MIYEDLVTNTMSATVVPICDKPSAPPLPPPLPLPTHTSPLTNKDKDLDEDPPVCRICHCSDDSEIITVITNTEASDVPPIGVCPAPVEASIGSLITPCFCSGSLRYVHHYCLQQWIRSSNHKYCELCKFHFKLTVKSKPLHKVSQPFNQFCH